MKHEYTDPELKTAIDGACNKVSEEHKYLTGILSLDSDDLEDETPARLQLIKAALAALPEPEPPTVDGKTPGQVAWDAGNEVQKRKFPNEPVMSWQEGYELHEEHEAAASAVLAAFGKQSQSQPQLSQLRPLSEAGDVPEGCVRVRAWEDINRWIYGREEWDGDTHFADIRLPEPSEEADPYAELKRAHADGKAIQILNQAINPDWIDALNPSWDSLFQYRIKPSPETFEDRAAPEPMLTKPISLTSWTPKVGDVVTLKSGGAKMTVVKLADTEGGLLAFLCEWFSDSGEYDSGVIYLTSLQPA